MRERGHRVHIWRNLILTEWIKQNFKNKHSIKQIQCRIESKLLILDDFLNLIVRKLLNQIFRFKYNRFNRKSDRSYEYCSDTNWWIVNHVNVNKIRVKMIWKNMRCKYDLVSALLYFHSFIKSTKTSYVKTSYLTLSKFPIYRKQESIQKILRHYI